MVSLSKRLQQIAAQVPQGSRLADIGSDHALLPVYLAQKGIISSAIAGELNPGPFAAAQKQVAEAGVQSRVIVRRGDGLEVIEAGEVDAITIAGMGGQLIVYILSNGIMKLQGVSRLVLQPNVGEEQVRRWLVEQGWYLSSEMILEEDGKIYEILTADRSTDATRLNQALYLERHLADGEVISTDRLYAMGPYLLQEANPILMVKWEDEIRKLKKISESLSNSELEASKSRREAVSREIAEIRRVLTCLPKVKR